MPGAEIDLRLVVLDASVVVRWVVPERGADEALELLSQSIDWIAPRLMLSEVAGALRRKVMAGELTPGLLHKALISYSASSLGAPCACIVTRGDSLRPRSGDLHQHKVRRLPVLGARGGYWAPDWLLRTFRLSALAEPAKSPRS